MFRAGNLSRVGGDMAGTFAVIGAGAWGTAVATLLAQRPGNRVRLWGSRPESVAQLRDRRENVRLLPGVTIPESVTITGDPGEAVESADAWVIAIPTAFLRDAVSQFRGMAGAGVRAVSLTKGIESTTFARPSEIVSDTLGGRQVAVLSGPSHAEEVARGMPTSVVVAASDAELAGWAQREFGTDRFRVYTNGDPVGVELAGALKNVIGIAAGVCDGLGLGDNSKAALLTRGLVEMTRFGVAHGAEPATFAGLAGMGDLITTCFSRHGRNRMVGERLACGGDPTAVLAGPQVAEGVNTSRSVNERCRQMRVDVPIMAAVYAIVHEGKPPAAAVQELMTRRQRGEDRF
jgi:glycerol-3-phosphate dehydrogenase (NAD(P)+)